MEMESVNHRAVGQRANLDDTHIIAPDERKMTLVQKTFRCEKDILVLHGLVGFFEHSDYPDLKTL
jgi:hypothetical protein